MLNAYVLRTKQYKSVNIFIRLGFIQFSIIVSHFVDCVCLTLFFSFFFSTKKKKKKKMIGFWYFSLYEYDQIVERIRFEIYATKKTKYTLKHHRDTNTHTQIKSEKESKI